jgi:hypothetical protein
VCFMRASYDYALRISKLKYRAYPPDAMPLARCLIIIVIMDVSLTLAAFLCYMLYQIAGQKVTLITSIS